jgi:hypothetical protein
VEQEVNGLRRGEVGEDGVEGGFDAEEEGRRREDEDVEDEDDVADAEQAAALAHQQCRDLGAVQHRAAADGEPDAGADEEAAEDGRQELVGRHVGEVDEGEAEREPRDGRRALQGEAGAHLLVAERDEGEVDDGYQERQRHPGHVRDEHRDAGHAAVDEVARQQKAFQPERGRKYPERDERDVDGRVRVSPHAPRIDAPGDVGQTGEIDSFVHRFIGSFVQ